MRRRSSPGCRSSSARDHPAGLPVFAIARPHPDAIVTDVEMWSIRVAGWGAAAGAGAGGPGRDRGGSRPRLGRRRPPGLGSPRQDARRRSPAALRRGRRIRAQPGPRRQPRNPLYGHRRRPGGPDRALSSSRGCNAPARSNPRCRCPTFSVRSRVPACSRSKPYVPGKSSAPGVARIHKLSSNETPLGPSPKAIAAYQSVAAHLEDYPDGAATKLREAIGRAFGLDPGAHRVRRRLRRPPQPAGARLSRRRRRGDPHHPRLPGLSDRDARAPARSPWSRAEKNHTADVDAILGAVTRTHPDRVPRQSEQSDRHLRAVRRGQAPASRPAAAHAAGARCRLCRIRPAQRLRVRHRAGRDLGKRRDVPHLLQGPRARRAAARLDVRAGPCGRRGQPHPRAVQRQFRRPSPPASRRSRMPAMSSARPRTTRNGWPG